MHDDFQTIPALNPFRYRGYRYDADTGFYYLQSRYYDPTIGRFINADGLASTGQGFIGYNMFAYCNNNPVNCSDPTGYALGWTNQVVISDSRYSSYTLAPAGEREEDLTAHHLNNLNKNVAKPTTRKTAVSKCNSIYEYTELESDLEEAAKGAVSSMIFSSLEKVAFYFGGELGESVVNCAEQALEFALIFLEDQEIPIGRYEMYKVVTIETYANEIPGRQNVVTTTYYIDKVIGIDREWAYIGSDMVYY